MIGSGEESWEWKSDLTDHEGVLNIASRSASGDFEVEERQRIANGLAFLPKSGREDVTSLP